MPRVALTAAQKEAARQEKRMHDLADGLVVYRARNRLTQKKLAAHLGVDPHTLVKLEQGKPVTISTAKLWKIFDVAGLKISAGL